MITVRYFASLRERLGRDRDELDSARVATVRDVLAQVGSQGWPANVLMAVNQEYADPDHPVSDGDEVAFFPPVTGG